MKFNYYNERKGERPRLELAIESGKNRSTYAA